METSEFDHLARHVAGLSRRRSLGAIAAGVASVLLPISVVPVAAACTKVGRACNNNSDCCNNARCRNDKCRCKAGFDECDGKCFKLESSEKHCGNCQTGCQENERCCGGTCTDRQTDSQNCGSCGNACDPSEECWDGVCTPVPGGCAAGSSTCLEQTAIACPDNPDCFCQRTVEGRTVCVGKPLAGVICGCESSADCAETLGPNAVCIQGDGVFCCGPSLPNVCRLSCSA